MFLQTQGGPSLLPGEGKLCSMELQSSGYPISLDGDRRSFVHEDNYQSCVSMDTPSANADRIKMADSFVSFPSTMLSSRTKSEVQNDNVKKDNWQQHFEVAMRQLEIKTSQLAKAEIQLEVQRQNQVGSNDYAPVIEALVKKLNENYEMCQGDHTGWQSDLNSNILKTLTDLELIPLQSFEDVNTNRSKNPCDAMTAGTTTASNSNYGQYEGFPNGCAVTSPNGAMYAPFFDCTPTNECYSNEQMCDETIAIRQGASNGPGLIEERNANGGGGYFPSDPLLVHTVECRDRINTQDVTLAPAEKNAPRGRDIVVSQSGHDLMNGRRDIIERISSAHAVPMGQRSESSASSSAIPRTNSAPGQGYGSGHGKTVGAMKKTNNGGPIDLVPTQTTLSSIIRPNNSSRSGDDYSTELAVSGSGSEGVQQVPTQTNLLRATGDPKLLLQRGTFPLQPMKRPPGPGEGPKHNYNNRLPYRDAASRPSQMANRPIPPAAERLRSMSPVGPNSLTNNVDLKLTQRSLSPMSSRIRSPIRTLPVHLQTVHECYPALMSSRSQATNQYARNQPPTSYEFPVTLPRETVHTGDQPTGNGMLNPHGSSLERTSAEWAMQPNSIDNPPTHELLQHTRPLSYTPTNPPLYEHHTTTLLPPPPATARQYGDAAPAGMRNGENITPRFIRSISPLLSPLPCVGGFNGHTRGQHQPPATFAFTT